MPGHRGDDALRQRCIRIEQHGVVEIADRRVVVAKAEVRELHDRHAVLAPAHQRQHHHEPEVLIAHRHGRLSGAESRRHVPMQRVEPGRGLKNGRIRIRVQRAIVRTAEVKRRLHRDHSRGDVRRACIGRSWVKIHIAVFGTGCRDGKSAGALIRVARLP